MKLIKYPRIKDILFLKGDINYTEFHLVNGGKVVSSYTLKKHQGTLHGFLRVSKQYLVNPAFVDTMCQDGPFANVILNNGDQLKVSRRRIGYIKMNLL